MSENSKLPKQDSLKALLSRGGAILAAAVAAYSRGITPNTPKQWSVLSPSNRAAIEEILEVLSLGVSHLDLKQALQSSFSKYPNTSLPLWIVPVYQEENILSVIGQNWKTSDLKIALGVSRSNPSDREKGLAAVAIALCRLHDTLLTLSYRLPSEEGSLLIRMGRLAGVLAEPSFPSNFRNRIKIILKGTISWEE